MLRTALLAFLLAVPTLQSAGSEPASLPKQVWATLPQARQAASLKRHALVLLAAEDATRYQTALAFFKSVEGVKARLNAEVWLPTPGDLQVTALLDELGLRSLPALVALAPSGKRALRTRLGEDCVPLAAGFEAVMAAAAVPNSWLQAWIGPDQAMEPFLAFAQARAHNLGAGALEPHRTWLTGLEASKDERLRNWAATRLVEADAPLRADEPPPLPVVLTLAKNRFDQEVRRGNRDSGRPLVPSGKDPAQAYAGFAYPPLADLGMPGRLASEAPCWPALRQLILNSPGMLFTIPLYVLLAPELKPTDITWIRTVLERQAGRPEALAANTSVLYWITTEWLLAYGRKSDWEAFRPALDKLGWSRDLAGLMADLDRVPGFWESEPGLQDMFCEGETQESFWEHPEVCLSSWGVTREALVEFGMDQMRIRKQPSPPRYPIPAKLLGISATLRLRILVGVDGKPRWVRPEPGYALALFASSGLAYAMTWQFEPARVAGVARPSQFILTMPFRLSH